MSGVLHGVLASLKTAAAAVTDAFFKYVTLLLNTITTNGAQNNTFLDASTNAFSITRNGNTTQGTFSPFSQTGWSNYFDGTGDWLNPGTNAAFAFGTGDFTVEAFVCVGSSGAGPFDIYDSRVGTTGSINGFSIYVISNSIRIDTNVAGVMSGGVVPTNVWAHVAVTRAAGTWRLFVDGVQVSTTTASYNLTDGYASIGAYNGTLFFNGYLSNVRLVKGTAVYTANFTPPTSPLTAITNTSLLTCQSNRFIDNSSNAFAITRNGDVSVQAFSPFNPTTAWTAGTNGGSGYFDGTGDYLSSASNAAFSMATGPYTVELWVYLTASQATGIFLQVVNGLQFSTNNTNNIAIAEQGVAFDLSSTTPVPLNQWVHLAASRDSGNTTRIFLNGTEIASGIVTKNYGQGIAYINYNVSATTVHHTGYYSNVRIVKGTAVYTANFTPPTAPLTAITNTSLLLNFTNAGIFDSASGNDLETVGNAQVSTAVAKWGTTSLAFDGTGDWLTAIDRPTQRLGTGDFTIEGWVYLNAAGVAYGIVSKGTSTTGWSVNVTSGNKLQFSYTATQLTGATSLAATTWYHFAVVRLGSASGNLKVYLNGTADATSAGAVTDNFNQTNVTYVGADRVAGSALNGYIDDLRITNGYARYTANFTPPTAAFPLN